jgi:hypothetical protein
MNRCMGKTMELMGELKRLGHNEWRNKKVIYKQDAVVSFHNLLRGSLVKKQVLIESLIECKHVKESTKYLVRYLDS